MACKKKCNKPARPVWIYAGFDFRPAKLDWFSFTLKQNLHLFVIYARYKTLVQLSLIRQVFKANDMTRAFFKISKMNLHFLNFLQMISRTVLSKNIFKLMCHMFNKTYFELYAFSTFSAVQKIILYIIL